MKSISLQQLFSFILGAICFFVVFAFSYVTYADEDIQSVTLVNAAPIIDTISTSNDSFGVDQTSIVPAEGSDFVMYIHGTAHDQNGCGDIDDVSQWTLRLYRSGVSGEFECSDDDANCYNPSSSSTLALTGCTGPSDTDITYQWTITLKHYIEPTDDSSSNYSSNDWKARVVVNDVVSGADFIADAFEVATLRALTVPPVIDYGILAPGATSEQKNIDVTNTGNDDIDFYVKASGEMVCDRGSIPASNIRYNLSDAFDYDLADGLSGSDAPVNATITRRTTVVSKKTVYLKLKVPTTGVSGHCTNTVTFTAKANE